jgi:hypothetical protein
MYVNEKRFATRATGFVDTTRGLFAISNAFGPPCNRGHNVQAVKRPPSSVRVS